MTHRLKTADWTIRYSRAEPHKTKIFKHFHYSREYLAINALNTIFFFVVVLGVEPRALCLLSIPLSNGYNAQLKDCIVEWRDQFTNRLLHILLLLSFCVLRIIY